MRFSFLKHWRHDHVLYNNEGHGKNLIYGGLFNAVSEKPHPRTVEFPSLSWRPRLNTSRPSTLDIVGFIDDSVTALGLLDRIL